MTVEQGEAEAMVRIRASRRAWIWRFVPAGACLAFAAGFLLIDRLRPPSTGDLARRDGVALDAATVGAVAQ